MRAWFTVLVVVAVTSVAAGCSQSTTPTSPSSVVVGTSAATSESITAQGGKSTADTTTVVLACDGAVNAQVDFRLADGLFAPLTSVIHLECGPDSFSGGKRDTVKVTTSQQAGWAFVDTFTVQTGAFNGGCPGGTAVPGTMECPGSSKKAPAANATLTFK